GAEGVDRGSAVLMARETSPPGVRVVAGGDVDASSAVLTPDALAFVAALHRRFDHRRRDLLARPADRRARLPAGQRPDWLAHPAGMRDDLSWRVAVAPPDLEDRRVEITGPPDRKIIVNALNSGAQVFMADFEDASSPTWGNVVIGQDNLMRAVRRTIDFT